MEIFNVNGSREQDRPRPHLVVVDEAGPRDIESSSGRKQRVSLAASITFAPTMNYWDFAENLKLIMNRYGLRTAPKGRKASAAFLDDVAGLFMAEGIALSVIYFRLDDQDCRQRFVDMWARDYKQTDRLIREIKKKKTLDIEFSPGNPSTIFWLNLLGGASAHGMKQLAMQNHDVVTEAEILFDRLPIPRLARRHLETGIRGLFELGISDALEQHGFSRIVNVKDPRIVYADDPTARDFPRQLLHASDLLASMALRSLSWNPVDQRDFNRLESLKRCKGDLMVRDRTVEISTPFDEHPNASRIAQWAFSNLSG